MKKKWTTSRIRALKGKTKISCLTAYDYSSAKLVDEAGLQLVLVGDSLGMTVLGYETTLPVTMEEMLHHTKAVVRGTKYALVVADLPFLSYQVSDDQAVLNAGRMLKEAGADAVKIEGGAIRSGLVKRLVDNGIPVMGHLGLTPQSVLAFGGYKVQAKLASEAKRLKKDAQALTDAGVFSIVLECIPAALAEEVTKSVSVPTIGIGAGAACDGQILVYHDILGLYSGFQPKFVKKYAELGGQIKEAFSNYRSEVEEGHFPSDEHAY